MEGLQVKLRAMELSDLPAITTWNFDEEINEFMPARFPNNLEQQRKWFDNQFKDDKKKLIIVEKISNLPVGLLGVMNIDHINKNCEIGITIGEKKYWGKGYSKEAMGLIISFLFQQMNMHIIYLQVFETNLRGVNFFKKCGFRVDGKLKDKYFKNGAYVSYLLMSLSRTDFMNSTYE